MQKAIAVWDRKRVAPKSKSVFVLMSDGQFWAVEPERELMGKDRED